MHAKQVWWIVTNPYTMVAKFFKTKYHSTREFKEANNGRNLYFTWRNMCMARVLLRAGTRWAIWDDGTNNV
jgi:hypothetical protein